MKKGAWLQFEGEMIGQGKEASRKALQDDPALAQKILAKIKGESVEEPTAEEKPAEEGESTAAWPSGSRRIWRFSRLTCCGDWATNPAAMENGVVTNLMGLVVVVLGQGRACCG